MGLSNPEGVGVSRPHGTVSPPHLTALSSSCNSYLSMLHAWKAFRSCSTVISLALTVGLGLPLAPRAS